MSHRSRRRAADAADPPRQTGVVDDIPDRSPRPAAWKYVLLAAVLLGWTAFLIYCAVAGNIK